MRSTYTKLPTVWLNSVQHTLPTAHPTTVQPFLSTLDDNMQRAYAFATHILVNLVVWACPGAPPRGNYDARGIRVVRSFILSDLFACCVVVRVASALTTPRAAPPHMYRC